MPQMNVERVRLVLDDLPNHHPTQDVMITYRAGGGYAVCAWGGFGLTIARHGGPIRIVNHTLGVVLVPTHSGWLLDTIADWLGLTTNDLRVPAEQLPVGLRRRIATQMRSPFVGVWPMNGLADSGVAFADIADALRVVLGVDADTVEGTPEQQALEARHVAAEVKTWGLGETDEVAA